MQTYTIALVAWLGAIFISNTSEFKESCCEGKGYYSLALGPGTFQIDHPNTLIELVVYSQVPYKPVAFITNSTSVIKYHYDNIMFYANRATTVKLTILESNSIQQ